MEINFSPKRTVKILSVVIVFLTFASFAGQFSKHVLGHDHLRGFVPLFNVNTEGNVPTWFTSFEMLLCAGLLWLIAHAKKLEGDRFALHWTVLAIIFLYMSLDEGAGVHDVLDFSLPSMGYVNSAPRFVRMLPATIFLIIFVLMYLKFLLHLPARTRLLFIVAGTIYVSGGFGMGFIMERVGQHYGWNNMTIETLAAMEEFMEMAGLLVFIYALMSYLSLHVKDTRIRFDEIDGATAPRV